MTGLLYRTPKEGKHYVVYLDDVMELLDKLIDEYEGRNYGIFAIGINEARTQIAQMQPAYPWPTDVPDTDRDGYGEGCRIEMVVEDVPAVDAVEVVRCRECKHWKHFEHLGCTDEAKVCMLAGYMIGANGYCLYGERRGEDA